MTSAMDVEHSALQKVTEAWQLFAAGELSAAIREMQQALTCERPPTQARAALGFFLIQADRDDEAADILLPALEVEPGYAPLHWYAGYLHQRSGNLAAAAAATAKRSTSCLSKEGTKCRCYPSILWACRSKILL